MAVIALLFQKILIFFFWKFSSPSMMFHSICFFFFHCFYLMLILESSLKYLETCLPTYTRGKHE